MKPPDKQGLMAENLDVSFECEAEKWSNSVTFAVGKIAHRLTSPQENVYFSLQLNWDFQFEFVPRTSFP
jgi:hypothetical protein